MPLISCRSRPWRDGAGLAFGMMYMSRSVIIHVKDDALRGSDGCLRSEEFFVVFNKHREEFERVASDKFDSGKVENGDVVVRASDLHHR